MSPIRGCLHTLERLSLVSCSSEVLKLLEQSLKNIEPMLQVDTKGKDPLIWQKETELERLHCDEVRPRLDLKSVKANAPKFIEDYVVVGRAPRVPLLSDTRLPSLSNKFNKRSLHYIQRRNLTGHDTSQDDLKLTAVGKPKAKYGGRFMVTMLPGDGIGPEMMRHVRNIFALGGFPVDFEEINLDSLNENIEKVEEAITSIKRNGVAIKGNIETREHSKYFKSRNVELRTRLDLFANIVHIRSQPSITTRHKNIDLVLIRQNTEGEYSSIEHETVPGVVECLKVVTRQKSKEIARYAFEFAVKNHRKKVSCVHKANIMKVSDGLFLEVAREVSKSYPNIEFQDIIIDNCSMQLVSNPWQFDVLLLPNLYGAVLTNIACGLVGGPGLISGVNFGPEYAVFETGTRNTGKGMTGRNVANPIAVLNASADLLVYLRLEQDAAMLRSAINTALNEARIHTPDLGGQYSTTDVVNFVMSDIRQQVTTH